MDWRYQEPFVTRDFENLELWHISVAVRSQGVLWVMGQGDILAEGKSGRRKRTELVLTSITE
ncbi:hypothetical protein E4U55_004608 [Claviceps digitariae]|nr:hypothetical protein E4U55_004608 [Claviceps digitariae]